MSENTDALRQAADRLDTARRAYERGEEGLRLLQRSRTRFIHSLRNTGLTYSQARIKYDNCLDEQRRLHEQEKRQLQYAERLYASLCAELDRAAKAARSEKQQLQETTADTASAAEPA